MTTFAEALQQFSSTYRTIDSGDLQSFALGWKAKVITIDELIDHLTCWFGEDWNGQSGSQVYAMVIDLIVKLDCSESSDTFKGGLL